MSDLNADTPADANAFWQSDTDALFRAASPHLLPGPRVSVRMQCRSVEQPRANRPTAASEQQLEAEQAYARLRRIAGKLMKNERPGHTLWPTEVVHEAMARLLESGQVEHNGSMLDLISRAAHLMTQVLIDHARQRGAIKRGRGRARVSLEVVGDLEAAIEQEEFNWAALDRILDELSKHDPRRHQVVMLRFFGGLDNRQIARELKLDERTISRDWSAARLWLKKQLQEDDA